MTESMDKVDDERDVAGVEQNPRKTRRAANTPRSNAIRELRAMFDTREKRLAILRDIIDEEAECYENAADAELKTWRKNLLRLIRVGYRESAKCYHEKDKAILADLECLLARIDLVLGNDLTICTCMDWLDTRYMFRIMRPSSADSHADDQRQFLALKGYLY